MKEGELRSAVEHWQAVFDSSELIRSPLIPVRSACVDAHPPSTSLALPISHMCSNDAAPMLATLLTDARFVGAWTLASFTSTAADGTVTHPYGEGVRGSIVYTADGTVAYQLVGGEGGGAASPARRFASRDFLRGTDAELAAAARAARSYVGAWHAADGVVTHVLSLSVHADREGRTMRRHFEFRANGDELSLVPVTRPGAPREELVWRRVGRAEAVAAAAAAAAAADAADADDARAAAGRAT